MQTTRNLLTLLCLLSLMSCFRGQTDMLDIRLDNKTDQLLWLTLRTDVYSTPQPIVMGPKTTSVMGGAIAAAPARVDAWTDVYVADRVGGPVDVMEVRVDRESLSAGNIREICFSIEAPGVMRVYGVPYR